MSSSGNQQYIQRNRCKIKPSVQIHSLIEIYTSTISSKKRSSGPYNQVEQRFFVKISRRDGSQCRQIHLKFLERYGDDTLSYSEVCYCNAQFVMVEEFVEDASRTAGRSPDFSVQL
jgi:hypothetical protein